MLSLERNRQFGNVAECIWREELVPVLLLQKILNVLSH